MTGHACPECGVQRPGCACAQAELAAAEDFDPLRIRPYVTLDAPEDLPGGAPGGGAQDAPGGGVGGPGSYGADGPPTAQLAAIRPEGVGGGPEAYPTASTASHSTDTHLTGAYPTAPHPADAYPTGPAGDPSETMPLLLRGVSDVPPPPGHERGEGRGRGRRRGMLVAAVAAVAVAGTAALAAAVLGGGEGTDDRAAVPDVTTSASLNLAVSEAPSASSGSPEPRTSSPTPSRTPTPTSSSPSPSASRTTSTPSAPARTTGAAAPPASSSAPVTAPTTTRPATTTPPAEVPGEGEEEAVTLSLGPSGPEVRELQRRLEAVWAYHGRINGRFDEEVQEAVARYQSWRYVQDDPEGVYGPTTRRLLEENTPEV